MGHLSLESGGQDYPVAGYVEPVLLLLAMLSCGDKDPGPDTGGPAEVDGDGDGWLLSEGDCDDGNGAVSPGAPETCNGRDDDCDGLVDEDPVDASTWYPDLDGDGFAGADGAVVACDDPSGWGSYVADCDDQDPAIHPGAEEICNGVDDDCDEDTSEHGLVTLDGAAADGLLAAVAASLAGSVIQICGGEWEGDLLVSHDLTVQGGGASLTGSGTGSVVTVTAGSLTLESLSITGGAAEAGGCVMAEQAAALTLVSVELTDCTADDRCGGLAGPLLGPTTLSDSLLVGHSLGSGSGRGGCICAHDLALTNTEIAACSARQGGGVWLDGDAVADDDSVIRECVAIGEGGGLWLEGASWTGGRIEDNAAIYGGGVGGDLAGLTDVVVQRNGAERDGGGLWGQGLVLSRGQVIENRADRGGGAFLTEGSLITTLTDWGTGTADNDPDDLASDLGSWSDLEGELSCTTAGCD